MVLWISASVPQKDRAARMAEPLGRAGFTEPRYAYIGAVGRLAQAPRDCRRSCAGT